MITHLPVASVANLSSDLEIANLGVCGFRVVNSEDVGSFLPVDQSVGKKCRHKMVFTT